MHKNSGAGVSLVLSLMLFSLPLFAADDKAKDTYDVPVVVEHRSTNVAPPAPIRVEKTQSEKPAPETQKSAQSSNKATNTKTNSTKSKAPKSKAPSSQTKKTKNTTPKKSAPPKAKTSSAPEKKSSADAANNTQLKKKHRKTRKPA